MKTSLFLLFFFLCEEVTVLVACQDRQPPPISFPAVPLASTSPPAPSLPPSSTQSVPDAPVGTVVNTVDEDDDLRTQSYKSMCTALAKTCGGPGDAECRGFMDAYFNALTRTKGALLVVHIDQTYWVPTGWMTGLTPWKVFCVAGSRTAADVRSCNTTLECKDPGPIRKLR